MNIFPHFIGLIWVYNRIYVLENILRGHRINPLTPKQNQFYQVIPDKCSSNYPLKSAVSELSFFFSEQCIPFLN